MSLLIEIRNDRVCRASIMEDNTKDRCLSEYPYCPDNDPTNIYASALRKMDYRKSQGEKYEIVISPDGTPEDYMLKKYSNGEFIEDRFDNINDRKKDLAMSRGTHVIRPQRNSLIPNIDEIDDKIGAGTFKYYLSKITSYEDFSNAELSFIESKLPQFSEDTRNLIIYQIANSLKGGICKNPGPYRKDNALYWWSKLIGTDMEISAWSAIAGIYVQHREYGDAMDIYKELEKRTDLNEYYRNIIEERIDAIGSGLEFVKEAEEEKNNPDRAIELLDEFEEKATGLCYLNNKAKALNLRGVCYGKIGRECGEINLIKYAAGLIKKDGKE